MKAGGGKSGGASMSLKVVSKKRLKDRERKSRPKPTWQQKNLERRRKGTSVAAAKAALLKKIATVASFAWTSQGLEGRTR